MTTTVDECPLCGQLVVGLTCPCEAGAGGEGVWVFTSPRAIDTGVIDPAMCFNMLVVAATEKVRLRPSSERYVRNNGFRAFFVPKDETASDLLERASVPGGIWTMSTRTGIQGRLTETLVTAEIDDVLGPLEE